MQINKTTPLLKQAKKKMTIRDIAHSSYVSVRTVNRIFAGKDVRFSSLVAVFDTLGLNLLLQSKAA